MDFMGAHFPFWKVGFFVMGEIKRNWLPFTVLISIFVLSFILTVPQVGRVPLCFFHWITRFDCPGCGLTRSLISISHGQFLQAIRFNALGPVVYLFFLIAMIRCFFPRNDQMASLLPNLRSRWSYVLFAVLFWGQWILKLLHQIPKVLLS